MLTNRQRELLLFIDARDRARKVAPSFDEMMAAVGLSSKSEVYRILAALEERGFIQRLPHRARAIEVLRRPDGSPSRTSKALLEARAAARAAERNACIAALREAGHSDAADLLSHTGGAA